MAYYTETGQYIRNPVAYAQTGAPMFKSRTCNTNINKPTSIYIAYLEKGKKYIGKTTDFNRRCYQHFSGKGAKVTQKFKPYKINEVGVVNGFFSDCAEQDLTEKTINICGYENVRGGAFTNSQTLVDHRCYF